MHLTNTIKIIHHIKIALVAQFITVIGAAQPGRLNIVPKTGSYEEAVQLSYDSVTKEVSGYVKIDVNALNNPKKIYRSCAVLFVGKVNGSNTCKVDFYNSQDIELVTTGEAVFEPDKITLTAKSGEGYCNDILDLTGELEMDFAKGRMVMILGVKEGWVKIEYIGKKVINGWIRKSELSPGFR